MNLTLKNYINGVKNKKFTPKEIIEFYLNKSSLENSKYNAFVRFHEDYVFNNLEKFSNRKLKSAPLGIKDLILTKGYISSGSSKILQNYVAPYSATCIENLENNGGLMLGKTNCDQFGMGTSTENSYFGSTLNPYGINRTPGGSSGGSAVCVSADMCLGSYGTDTGGSCRQPASVCNIVGLKPTYGRVSRYGVMAYASSFDQVGVFAKTVEDSKILLDAIAGSDNKDLTTEKNADQKNRDNCFDNINIKNYKIAIPKEFLGEGLDPKIKQGFLDIVDMLRKNGVQVDEVSLPILSLGLSIYYTLTPAEVSTNLSRIDGIKFGLQKDTMEYKNLSDYYKDIRSDGFGDEVKRRIIVGTFVLSSSNYEGYYLRAQKAREYLKYQIFELYKNYDLILSPTCPEVAWKLGDRVDDPLKMYLADLYTVTANLVGIPAISIPGGFVDNLGEKMPRGFQLMANKWKESTLFEVGNWLEKELSINKYN